MEVTKVAHLLTGGALLQMAQHVWWWFRQVSGDAAYENYLRQAGRTSIAACPSYDPEIESGHILSREEFYLDALRRRYSGVSRCC